MPSDLYDQINEARRHPEHYWGVIPEFQDNGWMLFISRHRDSDVLENSNFEVVLQRFHEKYELNEDFRVEGSSHWAVGWLDQMMVRALQCKCEDWDDAYITKHPDAESKGLKLWRCQTCGTDFGIEKCRPIVNDVMEIAESLSNYPVLDEEDFCRREHEELMEWLEQEVGHFVRRLEGEKIKEDAEIEASEVAEYLFEVHNVSVPDEISSEWIEDGVLAVADKKGLTL